MWALPASGAITQRRFASPEEATRALVDALRAGDRKAMLEIFGEGAKGLVSSGPIEDYIRKYLKVETFDQLKKPLAVVATDICSGEEVIFTRGRLDKAVRASCSIPGIYSPVELDGRQLVDGGMAENVPVKALKSLGADVVIAVNLFGHHQVFPPASNVFQIMMRVWYFFVREETAYREQADVVLEPDMRLFDLFDFSESPAIIAAGEKETENRMHEIKQVLERRFFFRPEIYR